MIQVEQLGMEFAIAGVDNDAHTRDDGPSMAPVDTERLTVLQDINFEVAQGDSVAIIGPSGSGKTTLLQLLAALEQPSRGALRIDGQNLADLSSDALADFRRDHMGIVFQSFHLIDSLDAQANAALPLNIQGRADPAARAAAMLDKVGLGQRKRHYPRHLSGGEQQRVALARALVHRPKLVLADEPTGNLDQRTGAQITDLLFELNAEAGASLILVTHDMRLAERCQHRFWLEDGRLSTEHARALSV